MIGQMRLWRGTVVVVVNSTTYGYRDTSIELIGSC